MDPVPLLFQRYPFSGYNAKAACGKAASVFPSLPFDCGMTRIPLISFTSFVWISEMRAGKMLSLAIRTEGPSDQFELKREQLSGLVESSVHLG